jgi:uncharacterized membrane protein
MRFTDFTGWLGEPMKSFLIFLGPLTLCVALWFTLTTYLTARKNPKCSVSRLFLKKEETGKAFYALIIGSCFFVVNQIFTLLYSLKLFSYEMHFLMSIFLGSLFATCLAYMFYKIIRVFRCLC